MIRSSVPVEIFWPDKEKWESPEPRILLEKKVYKSQKKGINDNLLIYGDNLLGLKALERDYTGKVKCIYIDPPYNTKSLFEHYDDRFEHSLWLNMMKERLNVLKTLLSSDGLLFIQIDDNEMAYLVILMDEIFGRKNRINIITVKMSESSGIKMSHADKRLPKLKEYVLVYKKEKTVEIKPELIRSEKWNEEYKTILLGISQSEIRILKEIINQRPVGIKKLNESKELLSKAYTMSVNDYFKQQEISIEKQENWKFNNAWRIVQFVGSESVLKLAKNNSSSNQEISAVLSKNGIIYLHKTNINLNANAPRIQMIFSDDNLLKNPGDLWVDIKTTGAIALEGGSTFPNGKKPEALLKRIIGMCTQPGDIVLDCFAGSGTTGAVAHKMNRQWIMIELREHCHTHIIPRLQSVIEGTDRTGVTQAVNWEGGGGFHYCELAPSLLEKNRLERWGISKKYNPVMLAEAICLHSGFTFTPKYDPWWIHGYSTERDFIHVTPSTLSRAQLARLSDEVGHNHTLLVYCGAFNADSDEFPNLTIKKIPKTILNRCEWGRDDYSLKIALESAAKTANKRSRRISSSSSERANIS